MSAYPLLSITTFLPIVGAVAVLLGGARSARWIALVTAFATLAVSAPLYGSFDKASSELQFVESAPWIPDWNITYGMGVDGISLPFIFLASLLTVLCVGVSWQSVQTRVKPFYAALLVAETAMIGLFAAANLFVFFVFWELMVVPVFLLIGVWGGPARVYAAVKFLLFTLAGSVLMLVGMIALHDACGSLDFGILAAASLSGELQTWLFLAFLAAFAVKVPMFPVHTWLPDAHTEAPTAGSVILAGILLKMGAYGFLRVSLPILPDAVQRFLTPMLVLSVIAIVYGAYVTLAQTDMKRLIAYSSVSHMGFVTLGIFTLERNGLEGAILQMVNHGVLSGALFLLVGMIYERTHSREIADYGGVARVAPVYSAFLALFCLAATGFPGLNSFVGELLILSGAFDTRIWLGALAVLGVVLGTVYIVWLFYRVIMGELNAGLVGLKLELSLREVATLAPLAVLAVCLGLYPELVLSYLHAPVTELLAAGVRTVNGPTLSDLRLVVPELILIGVALVLILLARRVQRTPFAAVGTVIAAVAAALIAGWTFSGEAEIGFGAMLTRDGYSQFFKVLIAVTLALAALLSSKSLDEDHVPCAEYHVLLLLAATGMMLSVSAVDLLVLYLGLELTTLCSYILVGIRVERPASNEAAIKYLLVGSFASALLLFGMSLLYGVTGATDFASIATALAGLGSESDLLLIFAVGLVAAGLAFKIAAVPFHAWAPDAYQGASGPVAAFLAASSKAAGLAALGRICLIALGSESEALSVILGGLAALSIVVGSIIALSQTNMKRLLAYSSIAHAGYALLGLIAGSAAGTSATMTYAFFYVFMTLGAFGVVIALGERGERLEGYRGLAAQRPVTAALMLLFLLSLIGIPPTAGFAAKFGVILSAVSSGHVALAVLAVVCSVISAYIYMRVAVLMYMQEPEEPEPARFPLAVSAALSVSALVTLVGGILPGSLVAWAMSP